MLSLADTNRLRAQPGRSVLLYITDQCPVGCQHCSVDALADGPRITDWPTFEAVVNGIAALDQVRVTAISGGEPFVERKGLPYAVGRFHDAGQQVVVFTSGYWAAPRGHSAAWIRSVLVDVATVYLSTDGFHEEKVTGDRFAAALTAVADAGAHIVVQLLDDPETIALAMSSLDKAFGTEWVRYAEINKITPLRRGRGRQVFQIRRLVGLEQLGTCGLLGSPTIRYDGVVMPCCNESLITGEGPDALRRWVREPADVGRALVDFRRDAMLRLLAGPGPAALGQLPGFAGLGRERYEDVCGACWLGYQIRQQDPTADAMLGLATQEATR